MAGNSAPRSVADATRFTSNTPHAATKSTPPNVTSKASNQTRPPPRPLRRPAGAPAAGPNAVSETMEERVRRLRAAHLAAKQHDISRMDRVINSSRRFFDAAHKFTVAGLIGFSGLALLVTVYATADMMVYNRKRRNEFFALQKQLKEDSLESARLAYMTGSASPEQIALVEDATSKAKEAGIALPSILSTPRAAVPGTAEATVWPGESLSETALEPETKKGGITGWLFGGLKKEEQSMSDERWKSTTTPTSTAATDVSENLRDKAKAAFDGERDNQRKGGPLDQIGLDKSTTAEGKKKGWLW